MEEVAAATGFDIVELSELTALSLPMVAVTPEHPSTEVSSDEQLSRTRLIGGLTQAIEQLPDRLQLLASLHYKEGLTYREISEILHVSEPRVCQLHGDLVKRLRATLEENGLADER